MNLIEITRETKWYKQNPVEFDTTVHWLTVQTTDLTKTSKASWRFLHEISSKRDVSWKNPEIIFNHFSLQSATINYYKGEKITLFIDSANYNVLTEEVNFYLTNPLAKSYPLGANLGIEAKHLGKTKNGNIVIEGLNTGVHCIVAYHKGDKLHHPSYASLTVSVTLTTPVTGCNGPFVDGVSGFCGCNCNCCPPKCCSKIAALFECGPPETPSNPAGCPPIPMFKSSLPMPGLPSFSKKIVSNPVKRFRFGVSGSCSFPCELLCIDIVPSPPAPVCCLKLEGETIIAIGNGWVTAPSHIASSGTCAGFSVFLNGKTPPIFVNDGAEIDIFIEPDDETCCACNLVEIACSTCSAQIVQRRLKRRRFFSRTSRLKLNPITGKPVVVLDRKELLRRLAIRRKQKAR